MAWDMSMNMKKDEKRSLSDGLKPVVERNESKGCATRGANACPLDQYLRICKFGSNTLSLLSLLFRHCGLVVILAETRGICRDDVGERRRGSSGLGFGFGSGLGSWFLVMASMLVRPLVLSLFFLLLLCLILSATLHSF